MIVSILKDSGDFKKGDVVDVKPIVYLRLKKAGAAIRGSVEKKKAGRPPKAK